MYGQSKEISSSIFEVDRDSKQIDLDKHFFKKDQIQIIKEGQRRKVIFGALEEQKKTLYQTLEPYLATLAVTTGNIATTAGEYAFRALKDGFWWAYEKITSQVIPYTAEQLEKLPKRIFVISKNSKKRDIQDSGSFTVLQVQEDIKKMNKKKPTIFIQMGGGETDQVLLKQLQKNHQIIDSMSFPIDDDDEDMQRQSYIIPSEQFSLILKQVQEQKKLKNSLSKISQQQPLKEQLMMIPEDNNQYKAEINYPELFEKKKIYRLPNYCIFDLENQNSNQYQAILQKIQINKQSQSGYFVLPEKLLRSMKSQSSNSSSNSDCVQKIQQPSIQPITQKKVDRTRNVRVEICENTKQKQLMLN